MNRDICYESDLRELDPQDIEKCYGPFESIDRIDSFGDTLLLASCKNKKIEYVKHYISLGANLDFVNGCGESPLLEIIDTAENDEDVSIQIIKILIDNGANLEVRGFMDKTPFLKACSRGSLNVLKLLVESGCDTKATVSEYDEDLDGNWFADTFHLDGSLKDYIASVTNT